MQNQVEIIFRGDKFLSLQARKRYREALLRFVAWAAEHSKLPDLVYLDARIVRQYVRWMLERGLSPRTIKTDVSALRHVHNFLCLAGKAQWRGQLPEPAELGVPGYELVPDRRWSAEQKEALVERAVAAGEERIADMIALAWELGLRLHEVVRLLRAQVEPHAVRGGVLAVKGKGGKWRSIPLTAGAVAILEKWRRRTPRGQRLFVREWETAGRVIKKVEDFIREHRTEPDPGYSELTFHGLRYSFAQREDARMEGEGVPERRRRKVISERLGHNREVITRTYVRW